MDSGPAATVLVAGDSPLSLEALKELAEGGRRPLRAASGTATLAILEQTTVDLLIVDWSTDGGGGALCRSVRANPERAGTEVLALLPDDGHGRTGEALEAGADDYLQCPFEAHELVARVGMRLRVAELRANEARLLALIDNVPGAIYRCAHDQDWTMDLIGEEIERISGYPASDFSKGGCRTFASVIHPDDRSEVERGVAEGVAAGRPFALEYRLICADGRVVWVLERGQCVRDPDGSTWLDGVIFDITLRRQAEQALRQRDAEHARLEEVRASRSRIIEAGDVARHRIERDLHDGAQQSLVSVALTLQLTRRRLGESPDPDLAESLDGAIAELNDAMGELRELARGIHPAVLTDSGLGPALEALAARAPVPVDVSIDFSGRLQPPVESAAYFTVAEALTNVARYSGAETASVEADWAEGCARITVSDNGVGGADPSRGSGLNGLRDRIAAVDGQLQITSEPGRGTTLRVEIPCEAPAAS